jgi:adenylate kinase
MIIIFLGPPGSGKGTQAKLLHQKLGGFYFEGGDVLRRKAEENNPLGKKIKEIIYQQGKLVPDSLMKKILEDWLVGKDIKKGIIFDGFPRSLDQYQILKGILFNKGEKITKVIFLKVSEPVLVRRLSSRRVCPKCGLEFNLITKPPEKDEVCDSCGAKLIQRADDTPEVIKARLKTYFEKTQALVDLVKKEGILEEIDGERKIEEIHQEILRRILR